MKKIHIPPAALEAGARAIAESLRTARLTLESEDGYKPEARAAFEAMVEAWPGLFEEYMNVEEGRAVVCMILPKGGDDD